MLPVFHLLACTSGPSSEADPPDTSRAVLADSVDSAQPDDSAPDSGDTGNPDTGRDDTGPLPADADADGFAEDVDCDDGDPDVHPGAADPCDNVDQDCDGGSYGPGSCGEVIDIVGVAEPVFDPAYIPFPVDDLTGDGIDDVFAYVTDPLLPTHDGESFSGISLFAGGSRGGELPTAPEDMLFCVVQGGTYPLFSVGDVDGDGTNDLVDAFFFAATYDIYLGPFPSDGRCLDAEDDVSAAWYPEWYDYPELGTGQAWGGDLDGDGVNDFVAGALSEGPSGGYLSLVQVFQGGQFGLPVANIELGPEGDLGGGVPELVGDLDGDGADDLAVARYWSQGGTVMVSGIDAVTGDGALLDDLALAILDNAGDPSLGYDTLGELAAVGDATGDGTSDFTVTYSTAESLGYQHGEVMFFDGSTRGTYGIEAAIGSWVGVVADEMLDWYGSLDLTCDGSSELLLRGYATPDRLEKRWYVPRSGVPSLREPLDGLTFSGEIAPQGEFKDIDGDGCDDIPLYVLEGDLYGAVYFGWPIPFDDPSAW